MPNSSTLHLIDAASPAACSATLALIAESQDEHSRVLLLGPEAMIDRASQLGLEAADHLSLPAGPVMFALAGLHGHLKRTRMPGLFHCWSVRSLTLAALVRPMAKKLLSLTQWPSSTELAKLRRVLHHQPRRVSLTTVSHAITEHLVANGISRSLVRTVSPAIAQPKQAQAFTPQSLRKHLQLDGHGPLIALLADPPNAADARHAALAVGLAGETVTANRPERDRLGEAPRLLLCPSQRHGPAARRMMRSLRANHVVVQCSQLAQPWRVLPGCDLAISLSRSPGTLSLAWAMMLAVPVAAQMNPVTQNWLTHEQNALLSPADQPKSLAFNVERCLRDASLAQRLARQARQQALARFDVSRYRQTLAPCRQQAAQPAWIATNQPVDPQQLPPEIADR